jgi:hypothetical protein
MTAISPDDVRSLSDKLGVNYADEQFTPDDLRNGIMIEAEHKDVVGDDSVNLRERPDYYDGLEYLEHAPRLFWRHATMWVILLIVMIVLFIYVLSCSTGYNAEQCLSEYI